MREAFALFTFHKSLQGPKTEPQKKPHEIRTLRDLLLQADYSEEKPADSSVFWCQSGLTLENRYESGKMQTLFGSTWTPARSEWYQKLLELPIQPTTEPVHPFKSESIS